MDAGRVACGAEAPAILDLKRIPESGGRRDGTMMDDTQESCADAVYFGRGPEG